MIRLLHFTRPIGQSLSPPTKSQFSSPDPWKWNKGEHFQCDVWWECYTIKIIVLLETFRIPKLQKLKSWPRCHAAPGNVWRCSGEFRTSPGSAFQKSSRAVGLYLNSCKKITVRRLSKKNCASQERAEGYSSSFRRDKHAGMLWVWKVFPSVSNIVFQTSARA